MDTILNIIKHVIYIIGQRNAVGTSRETVSKCVCRVVLFTGAGIRSFYPSFYFSHAETVQTHPREKIFISTGTIKLYYTYIYMCYWYTRCNRYNTV